MDDFFDEGGQGYVKAGFLGFTAGGKTYTAVELALGIRDHFKLDGQIAFFDTENGAGFFQEKVTQRTGKPLLIKRARSFDALMQFAKVCEERKVSVAIVDSLTHTWRELCDSYLAKVNEREAEWARRNRRDPKPRFNLQFEDWNPIKTTWATWTDWYLNSQMHVIICGRAGWDYLNETDERTGKKTLVKIGTKMKAESEFGFEPSLLVEMERVVEKDQSGEEILLNRGSVLKDRWDLLNGKVCDNPDFAFFKPHVEKFQPATHQAVDTKAKSDVPIEDHSGDSFHRELKLRTIACEEIQGELLKRWPSQTAADKASKAEKLEELFGTRSWTAVENMASGRLNQGLALLKVVA